MERDVFQHDEQHNMNIHKLQKTSLQVAWQRRSFEALVEGPGKNNLLMIRKGHLATNNKGMFEINKNDVLSEIFDCIPCKGITSTGWANAGRQMLGHNPALAPLAAGH